MTTQAEYDEYITYHLNRVATEHPDIVADQGTFLAYQQAVLDTGDFNLGYEQFARDQEALAMAAHESAAAAATPAERAAGAIGVYLAEKSMGMHR
jgi:hypothetical protein